MKDRDNPRFVEVDCYTPPDYKNKKNDHSPGFFEHKNSHHVKPSPLRGKTEGWGIASGTVF